MEETRIILKTISIFFFYLSNIMLIGCSFIQAVNGELSILKILGCVFFPMIISIICLKILKGMEN